MATIQRDLAEKLVEDQGRYKGDKQAYCVVRYQNRLKYDLPGVELYDPDAPVNCFDYAVCYQQRAYEALLNSPVVGGVDILWGSAQFKEDDKIKRQRTEGEEEVELMWFGLVEDKPRPKRRGKER